MIFRVFVTAFLLVVATSNCAKRGRPTGGPKDSIAPVMVTARPPFETINFDDDEIRIYFDEYIKLKDLNKQLVISPPMKFPPIITPLGTPSKYIKIKILDTLKENTTYTINFGQSVIDNTEGNILRNFKYVFSTGNYIDSLKVSGTLKDAFNDEVDDDIAILLYELNETYTDSLIYKEKPLYVGNSLDTTIWEIDNIKAGKYKLIALKDASKDYIFSPKQDKIAFANEIISIPQDSTGHELVLFKEVLPYEIYRPSEQTKNRLLFGYEGIADSIKINNLLEEIPSIITYEKDKDSLNYWYKDATIDSLVLEIRNRNFRDTVTVRRRSKKVDSLTITDKLRGSLSFREELKLHSNVPLESIDSTKITFTDRDTLDVPYNLKFRKDASDFVIDFKKKEQDVYKIEILPEAIKDFLGNTNDTLRFNFRTKKMTDYGNLYLTLQNVNRYPIIVQLVKSDGELVQEIYAETAQVFTFKSLTPGKYKIRVIYDDNKNGKWDTGNFLLNRQPEKVIYYLLEDDVRANWEMNETFILSNE
ncbi:MAG: Ig-like domain-containing protein [Flavobacteriaceae bacterium]|nr:Ig-like domain-containing protein [Flavobacteriaceae bacterium]